MIIIKNSEYSKSILPEETLSALTHLVKGKGVDFGIEITISYYYDYIDGKLADTLSTRFIVSCQDDFHIKGKVEFTYDLTGSLEEEMEFIALSCIFKKHCKHELDNKKDEFGTPYPDGRSKCKKCGVEYSQGVSAIEGRQVISMSFGEDIASRYDWGSSYIQGGRNGVVIGRGRKNYRTAFIEYFPTINGLGTFIRGEGNDVHKAEDSCWEKFQKMSACKNHEWTRDVRGDGQERKDGYARCIHCGMTATALVPTTKCFVCEKPTTNEFEDKHVCWKHYFKIDKEILLKDELESMKGSIFSEPENKATFDFNIRYEIEKLWFDEIGDDFEDRYRKVQDVYIYFSNFMLKGIFKISPLQAIENYPDMKDPLVIEALSYFASNMDKLKPFVYGKEKGFSSTLLIHEKYLEN